MGRPEKARRVIWAWDQGRADRVLAMVCSRWIWNKIKNYLILQTTWCWT
jgi:hypothetical protein